MYKYSKKKKEKENRGHIFLKNINFITNKQISITTNILNNV